MSINYRFWDFCSKWLFSVRNFEKWSKTWDFKEVILNVLKTVLLEMVIFCQEFWEVVENVGFPGRNMTCPKKQFCSKWLFSVRNFENWSKTWDLQEGIWRVLKKQFCSKCSFSARNFEKWSKTWDFQEGIWRARFFCQVRVLWDFPRSSKNERSVSHPSDQVVGGARHS